MTPVACRLLRALMLAALLFGTGLAGAPSVAQQRVGVNSAVNQEATGIPPGAAPRRLVLGQEVVFNERITTGPEGQTQILFVDQSAMTVGPRSDMVIDEFVYDPNAGTGKLAASLTRGVFRFVGGKLSKQDNAVTMRTPTATIGIRGAVMFANVAEDGRRVTVQKVYGKDVKITGLNGDSQTITGNGFESTVSGPGASPSAPAKSPPGAISALNNQVEPRAGTNGGAAQTPTDAMVVNSGVPGVVSGNLAASLQAAAATQPLQSQSPSAYQTIQQTVPPTTIQAGSLQGGPATATPVNPISPITPTPQVIPPTTQVIPPTAQVIPPTPPGPPPTTPVVTTPTPPVQPQPVVISVAGLAKSTNGPPTVAGFVDQTANGRVPYSSGTITYPPGSVPQNGTFTASIGGAGQVTLSPLTPGSTNAVSATSSTGATAAGTATMTADGNFFYANLVNT